MTLGTKSGEIRSTSLISRTFSFQGRLRGAGDKGRIRIDDWEMREDVQAKVAKLWLKATT